jgi:hypothetical protein
MISSRNSSPAHATFSITQTPKKKVNPVLASSQRGKYKSSGMKEKTATKGNRRF